MFSCSLSVRGCWAELQYDRILAAWGRGFIFELWILWVQENGRPTTFSLTGWQVRCVQVYLRLMHRYCAVMKLGWWLPSSLRQLVLLSAMSLNSENVNSHDDIEPSQTAATGRLMSSSHVASSKHNIPIKTDYCYLQYTNSNQALYNSTCLTLTFMLISSFIYFSTFFSGINWVGIIHVTAISLTNTFTPLPASQHPSLRPSIPHCVHPSLTASIHSSPPSPFFSLSPSLPHLLPFLTSFPSSPSFPPSSSFPSRSIRRGFSNVLLGFCAHGSPVPS